VWGAATGNLGYQIAYSARARLNRNPLDVVEAHILGAPVVEARGAGVGMVGHLARLLKRAAVLASTNETAFYYL
jgi:hypothetical protein